ncbi:hypothetical protein [Aminobacter sp. LjRoot7]
MDAPISTAKEAHPVPYIRLGILFSSKISFPEIQAQDGITRKIRAF